MTRWKAYRYVAAASCVVLWLSTAPAGPLHAQSADAERHKQWMNDASDAQEDFRFALTDNNQKDAVEALTRLEALMARTEDYWGARKADDGVKLARQTRALAAQALAAAKGGTLTAARDPFEKMGASCNSCHELHLEKR